jgi:DHA1 family tetracycline resistance protein-like MFS transporter
MTSASSIPPVPSPDRAPAGRRAALAFVLVTVMLDMLAIGVIVPVLPRLLLQFEGGDTADAAAVYGVFGTVFAAMQFLFSPTMGALSDRFGRRRVILISNLGLGLDYIVMALAPSVGWLLLGRVIAGLCGASIAPALAYTADVTPPEKRAASFGLINASFGVGFVIGPAVGGLLGSIALRLPFWVAAGLSLANATYGLFVLPESLPPERRSHRFDWKRANPIGSLMLLRRHPEVLGIAAVLFLGYVAHEVYPSVFVLYTDYRYGWGPREVGLALALVGVATAIVGAWLLRVILPALGERRSLFLGLMCGAIGFATYGLAPTPAWFCSGILVAALWGFAGPSAQALMTRRVDVTEQGRLQGAISGLRGVASMIGPGLFTTTFAIAIRSHSGRLPGAPFLVSSLLLVSSLGLALRVARR